ncbi:MAG: hypothetical protein AAB671_01750, partial [Patescibacteria group bacterium]
EMPAAVSGDPEVTGGGTETLSPEPLAGAPSAPEPPPEPSPQPDPAPVPPVPPPAQERSGAIGELLSRARAKIKSRKSAKLEKIAAYAREKGGITNDQAQKLLRVSDATATRHLSQLVREGRLRASGRTSGRRYTPVP